MHSGLSIDRIAPESLPNIRRGSPQERTRYPALTSIIKTDRRESPMNDQTKAPKKPAGGSGLSSGLQPGGTAPNNKPGATVGSIGTGGGSTAGRSTGNAREDDQTEDK
jgi:hypothetical protein